MNATILSAQIAHIIEASQHVGHEHSNLEAFRILQYVTHALPRILSKAAEVRIVYYVSCYGLTLSIGVQAPVMCSTPDIGCLKAAANVFAVTAECMLSHSIQKA